jgi:hypothetical protein
LPPREGTAGRRPVISSEGGSISGMTADISKPEDVRNVFDDAENFLGGLDVW